MWKTFENGGNEATKVRWNQMSRTLNLSWLKVARDDLMGFWPILGHLGGFATLENSADLAYAIGYGASGQHGAEADASSVQL